MKTFWGVIQWLVDKMKILGAVCLMVMTLLTCADVIGRAFRHPIFGSVEIVTFMATLSVVMALPYTHQVKGHIGVEMLVQIFSRRTQIIIDLCTSVLGAVLFAIVTWRMFLYARTMQRSGEVSMNLEIPEYLIIYVSSFCFLIFFIMIIQDIITYKKQLKGEK
jgi:TRAP-type C4-dicarboxylate transport system permease small subunit